MPRPTEPPIGLLLARTAKSVGRAFDDALTRAGGSLPIWLIMIALRGRRRGSQRELAEAVGIRGATLTHHLTGMERSGLVTRHRDAENRRVQTVALTEEGERLFGRLADAAAAYDLRLRAGLGPEEIAEARRLLDRMCDNIGGLDPW